LIRRAVHAKENVMRTGADIKQGNRVLSRGTQLGSREIGVLAAIGRHDVRVFSLRVGIISTGTELVPIDERLQAGQVHDVNSHTICAAVRECGASPVMYGIVSDEPEKTEETLEKAILTCDLVLTSGSTSAGSGDIMHDNSKNGKASYWATRISDICAKHVSLSGGAENTRRSWL
jgi:putative molybdopterin biosynthesis protein